MLRKKIEKRIDDEMHTLEKRIDGYFKETKPIIDKLNSLGDLVIINGIGDIKLINTKVNKGIRHLL